MSYGPHPNDFLFAECEFTLWLSNAHFQTHSGKMVSSSMKMNARRYTLTILYSETLILLLRKN